MGKGCITVTKYFLFLFNLLFFIFGALIMGFGLWVLFDNQSFITVLHESSHTVKVASYILIGVGSLSMAMGFFGCIGAIYEIRCLLGLYFTCLLLILIAQVTAGVLIYFQRDRLKYEMSNIMQGMIINYTGLNRTTEHTWDYIQKTMKCCGWTGPGNWSENLVIKNNTQKLYSCSCRNESLPGSEMKSVGLCEHLSDDLPVYETVLRRAFPLQNNHMCFILQQHNKCITMQSHAEENMRLSCQITPLSFPHQSGPFLTNKMRGGKKVLLKQFRTNCELQHQRMRETNDIIFFSLPCEDQGLASNS
uniref:CD82 molecule b n=1 Tax=Oryzias melastigma TaxID=30732 RepID=A0A3B3DIF4_ORYME